jgi:uncharacterized Zn finger protein
LLKARGDVDALIAAYAADLAPDGATHLRIARELDEAGRAGDALEWAERGLRAAGKRRDLDHQLVEWICARYVRAGRLDDALAVRRGRFRSHGSLAHYRLLRSAARACGCWEDEREAALELLREDASRDGFVPGLGHPPAYSSTSCSTRARSTPPGRPPRDAPTTANCSPWQTG